MRVFQVADARPALAFGQEEIPQAPGARLLLQAAKDFVLPRRMGPAVAHVDLGQVFPFDRFDLLADKIADFFSYFDQMFG